MVTMGGRGAWSAGSSSSWSSSRSAASSTRWIQLRFRTRPQPVRSRRPPGVGWSTPMIPSSYCLRSHRPHPSIQVSFQLRLRKRIQLPAVVAFRRPILPYVYAISSRLALRYCGFGLCPSAEHQPVGWVCFSFVSDLMASICLSSCGSRAWPSLLNRPPPVPWLLQFAPVSRSNCAGPRGVRLVSSWMGMRLRLCFSSRDSFLGVMAVNQ